MGLTWTLKEEDNLHFGLVWLLILKPCWWKLLWSFAWHLIYHNGYQMRLNSWCGVHMNILFINIKVKVFMFINEWSYKSPPPIMLIIEPRMVSVFWACSPISFKHQIFLGCPFLDPYLTKYHSYIGVQIIVMLELGMSTSWCVCKPWRSLGGPWESLDWFWNGI